MSVALDLVPVVDIPECARRHGAPSDRVASVSQLHAPALADSPPLRLTRRGVVVLSLAVAVLCAALLGVAAWSAPSAPAPRGVASGSTVTVRAGDTLWSIASRVASNRDPRAEVDALRSANGLRSVTLQPGQVLRVP